LSCHYGGRSIGNKAKPKEAAMKVCMFHLMPYRDLPADFEQRYQSAYIDPLWFDVADGEKVGQYYNATLDEMLYAAKAGLHGVCTNQHHQNVYGFMANPSLMGAALARQTNGQDVAIIQLGSTLPSTTPPTRIAEEYAMLDCISGGRLIAGFPTGLPADATISNAVVPVEQRERYREALALVTKAWSAKEVFAWNGKHYQLGMVNLWPRPIQQPHPPIWIPGAGVSSTAEHVVDLDHCFCHLSYFGLKNATQVCDRYWDLVARKGRDDNPYRLSFLQLIGVAATDAEAEDLYAAHAEYFFHKLLYIPPHYTQIPGCLEYPGLVAALQHEAQSDFSLGDLKAKDLYERGFVIVGSPKTVREKLLDGINRLRAGHLLTLLHFGSMSTALCKHNIDLFAREVLPHLENLWDDRYEDRWWPERLTAKRRAAAMAAAS
jgi:alkanesulfonate monooxygenase SsuD/methylene tetrahydromethanopterin reductase-like flavin-dependent oxidoreductase (luciferase family)